MSDAGRNEPIYSVAEVVSQVNGVLRQNFPPVWITGEVSNLRTPGHWYFDLIEQGAKIRCCLWRNKLPRINLRIENGDKINIRATFDIYGPSGSFSAIVDDLELAGEGQLRQEFERLKLKLNKEGLFANSRDLPGFPKAIAVISGDASAAIEDVITNINRRYPLTQLTHFPTLVQGTQAPREIVAALDAISQMHERFDLVLVTRGGGSFEDLNAFNDEAVARAIYASPIPVVSAIGHEIDYTIADFVADVRAPTPSTAAETVTPDQYEIFAYLDGLKKQLSSFVSTSIDSNRQSLNTLTARVRNPGQVLETKHSELDRILSNLVNSNERELRKHETRLDALRQRLTVRSPQNLVQVQATKYTGLIKRLSVLHPIKDIADREANLARIAAASLDLVNKNFDELSTKIDLIQSSVRLATPAPTIERLLSRVSHQSQSMQQRVNQVVGEALAKFREAVAKLSTASPLQTLERGYAVVSAPNDSRWGIPITSVADVHSGTTIEAHLKDGSIEATVTRSKPKSDDA